MARPYERKGGWTWNRRQCDCGACRVCKNRERSKRWYHANRRKPVEPPAPHCRKKGCTVCRKRETARRYRKRKRERQRAAAGAQ